MATGPLRPRFFPREPFPRGEALLFASGILILFLTVASPLHLLAEVYLLSAHMLQLSLLIYAVPPLLIAGTPAWLLKPLLTERRVLPVFRTLSRPTVAFVAFQVVFVLWHVPAVFRALLFHDVLHGLAYLTVLAASLLMWWPLLSPLEEAPRPPLSTRLVYLGALLAAHLPLMAALSLVQEPLYPWYAQAPRLFDLSPLADQQLGSAIMMAVTLVALLIPMCAVALRWLEAAEVVAPSDAGSASSPRPAEQRRGQHDGVVVRGEGDAYESQA